jgi:hypothetical protein
MPIHLPPGLITEVKEPDESEWAPPVQRQGLLSWRRSVAWVDEDENPYPDLLETGRYRFGIPDRHQGSKFFITYDIVDFLRLEDQDPVFVTLDNTIEWTGPGTKLTDWIYIDPPPRYEGSLDIARGIANLRFTSYTGTKFGVKPSVDESTFQLPPP